MLAPRAAAALVLLVGGAESWAPKSNAPVRFRRGNPPVVPAAVALHAQDVTAAARLRRVPQTDRRRLQLYDGVTTDPASTDLMDRRRLQLYDGVTTDPAAVDPTYEDLVRPDEHPDAGSGKAVYHFDQPTGLGSRWRAFGWPPVPPPPPTWRDPGNHTSKPAVACGM